MPETDELTEQLCAMLIRRYVAEQAKCGWWYSDRCLPRWETMHPGLQAAMRLAMREVIDALVSGQRKS